MSESMPSFEERFVDLSPQRLDAQFSITTCYDWQRSQTDYSPFYCSGNVVIWVMSIANSLVLAYITFLHFR